ncbi:hypothetical protein GWI33_004844 [Rhynchophorus ferrugineus]|uniref:Golgi apparatus protein 1 n=1 Tax=Rhynchophorus ferrugineus TaxID=354439 RepID=A0A834IL46_RHYFE|nr:hypothetical protein GWI33_004844 [Rhynchophorus ferrugineus]
MDILFTFLWSLLYLFLPVLCDAPNELLRFKRGSRNTIFEEASCRNAKRFCENLIENDDLPMLECLHSLHPNNLAAIETECHQKIWEHTNQLIKDNSRLRPVCESDMTTLNCDKDGDAYFKCLANAKENIVNRNCQDLIRRIENIAFTDNSFLTDFLKECEQDAQKLQCGTISSQGLSQINTIACLQVKIFQVSDDCKRKIFRLSEFQSDNIKFDQQLYLDCGEDYSRYCSEFSIGSGQVFHCLTRQDPQKLNKKCKESLVRREKLISQDYRVSKGLMRACRDDIKRTHCRKQTSSDRTIRLAQILLCLENVAKNGTKITSDCEAELVEHRRFLMEDYRLSPEIVDSCKKEISVFCNGFETGGITIHCLMKHAKQNEEKSKFDKKCRYALENLVKKTDVGENWNVDPVLHKACSPVVSTVCKDISSGDARVMNCLMDNIGSDHMTEDCEDTLIQIQYFISRRFELDSQLYKACKSDASTLCAASNNWDTDDDSGFSAGILPCLYRYIDPEDKDMQLEKSCFQNVRRVMRQRAASVDLQPEIEESCLQDLANFCHDKEAKNDQGDVMDCLISHKNEGAVKSNQACRASIEHFQIVSLKDYRFSYKFKAACKPYAMRFCGTARTKNEVVRCLSEQVLNATVNGIKSQIPRECKQQLKAQLFQQRESIDYDPVLKNACLTDIKKYCAHVSSGNAQVLECLQTVNNKLSNSCEKEVFKVKKQEIFDNTSDYALITLCADAIEQFCTHHDKENVFECLRKNKDEKGFNRKCRAIVVHRINEQNSNYQLNPSLQQNCHMDINKFCKSLLSAHNKETNGVVIKCLKEQFKLSRLSNKCEKEMSEMLKEQALNIELNPLISTVCSNELSTICKTKEGEDSGDTEECLKDALLSNRIQTPECKIEVANMIEESQADIQVDPMLQSACALDLLNFCIDIPQGNGRHIHCLKTMLENKKTLSPKCKKMLQKRLQMYKNAAQFAPVAPPENFQQLYSEVITSPSKQYFFFIIVMFLGVIFTVGILCGKFNQRKYMLLKSK